MATSLGDADASTRETSRERPSVERARSCLAGLGAQLVSAMRRYRSSRLPAPLSCPAIPGPLSALVTTTDIKSSGPAPRATSDRAKARRVQEGFQERVSSLGERKELEGALSFVREGDTFVVTKLDRLARSTQHALTIVEGLEQRGVGLRILDFAGEPIATKSPHGKLVLTMFAAFAEFERKLMLERQRAGIAKAKSEGKHKGRTPTARAKAGEVKALAAQGLGPSAIARHLGIGRSSVYRALE